jgi:hypothetical protein
MELEAVVEMGAAPLPVYDGTGGGAMVDQSLG